MANLAMASSVRLATTSSVGAANDNHSSCRADFAHPTLRKRPSHHSGNGSRDVEEALLCSRKAERRLGCSSRAAQAIDRGRGYRECVRGGSERTPGPTSYLASRLLP